MNRFMNFPADTEPEVQVLSLIIELNDGTKVDWFALTRDQRRMMKKKLPAAVMEKIKSAKVKKL